MSRREPLAPRAQLLMITGDVNCGAAAMRKPENGYSVGPNIGPTGE
jgi:hypothetical protein